MFRAIIGFFFALPLTFLPALALAESFSNIAVRQVFAESDTVAGFFPRDDVSSQCLFGVIYINLGTQAGRAQLSLVMQAKAQGLRVARVDYVKQPNGSCHVTGLHIQ